MKINLLLRLSLWGLALSYLITSCHQEVEPDQPIRYAPNEGLSLMKLGKQLENPYSVENMQKALDNIKSSGSPNARALAEEIEIETSHLYLRFTPRDSTDMDRLTADSTLFVYDYPLDYEIDSTVLGDYYHDPEIPLDRPTYQYCAVEIDQEIPDVPYIVLAELFIPEEIEEDSLTDMAARLHTDNFTDRLVYEAMRITDNLEEGYEDYDQYAAARTLRRRKWRGGGKVTYYDDSKHKVLPVTGLTIKLNKWFRTRTGITDTKGEYRMGGYRFRGKARYSFKWERRNFKLKDAWLREAGKRGPKKRGNWDIHFSHGSIQQHYCDVFRAAYHYYYKGIKGLRRPPKLKVGKMSIKVTR